MNELLRALGVIRLVVIVLSLLSTGGVPLVVGFLLWLLEIVMDAKDVIELARAVRWLLRKWRGRADPDGSTEVVAARAGGGHSTRSGTAHGGAPDR